MVWSDRMWCVLRLHLLQGHFSNFQGNAFVNCWDLRILQLLLASNRSQVRDGRETRKTSWRKCFGMLGFKLSLVSLVQTCMQA